MVSEMKELLRRIKTVECYADAGRFCELVTYLERFPRAQIERSPTLALHMGAAHARLGNGQVASDWLDVALRRAQDTTDLPIEAKATDEAARWALDQGRLDDAERLAERGRTLATRADDIGIVGRCSLILARVAYLRAEYEAALNGYRMALAAFERVGSREGYVAVRRAMAAAYHAQGERSGAHAMAEMAIDAATALPDPGCLGGALATRATLWIDAGEGTLGLRDAERALRLCHDGGNAAGVGTALRVMGLGFASLDRLDEAEACFQEALQHAAGGLCVGRCRAGLAMVYHRMGRSPDATAAAQAARDLFETIGAAHDVRQLDDALPVVDPSSVYMSGRRRFVVIDGGALESGRRSGRFQLASA